MRTPQATAGDALFSVVRDIAELAIGEARARGRVVACGVGCGGPMRPGSDGVLVSPLNIPAWRDFPLGSRLGAAISALAGTRSGEALAARVPVALDNDAKALALAEGWRGAAQGVSDYLAMVVSTGVGGGIVLNGRLLDGATGNAGHIGHVIVEPDGHECACGARGCLEAEVSGTGLRGWTGEPPESAGREVIERSGRLLGRAVASVANLLDLRLAVIGGGVALGFGLPFFVAAQRELDKCARLVYSRGCQLEPAGLGEEAPLVGAAAVGWQALSGRRPG